MPLVRLVAVWNWVFVRLVRMRFAYPAVSAVASHSRIASEDQDTREVTMLIRVLPDTRGGATPMDEKVEPRRFASTTQKPTQKTGLVCPLY